MSGLCDLYAETFKDVLFWLSGSQAKAQNRESDKTVLYLLIVIIILISYIIIKLLIKRRTILAETGNRTPVVFVSLFRLQYLHFRFCHPGRK
jgi:hypothetical protein